MRLLAFLIYCMAFCVVALFPEFIQADEKTERERRVKVALAISGEQTPSAVQSCTAPEIAPPPRPVDYQAAWQKSKSDLVPIVVYVGWKGPRIDDAACVVVHEYAGVDRYGVVVGYPAGAILVEEVRLKGDKDLFAHVATKDIQAAVESARKKIGKPMPAKATLAPQPFADYMIRSNCPCGEKCQCKPGQCPACPASSSGTNGVVPGPVVVPQPVIFSACVGPT